MDKHTFLLGVGKRAIERRERLGLSQEQVADRAGISRGYFPRIEKGRAELGVMRFNDLAAALEVNPIWLATGEGPIDPWPWDMKPVDPEDRNLIDQWRELPIDVQAGFSGLLAPVVKLARAHAHAVKSLQENALISAPGVVGFRAAEASPRDEFTERRERAQRQAQVQTLRLVGYVAAKDEHAQISFDVRLGDQEDYPAPPGEWSERFHSFVRVEGDSMAGAGIPDHSLLLIQSVELGGYHRGDIVIANTAKDGVVCKRYSGQSKGFITLKSVGEGKDITEPKEEDDVPGIEVKDVVLMVQRPNEEWERIKR